jgi:hypothetical protein
MFSTESAYKIIHFWFVCYRLKITRLSLHVDKTDSQDVWRIIPKKVED